MSSLSGERGLSMYGGRDPEIDAERERGFSEGRVPVAVYGLGKMGLPLATVFADATGNVIGVDIDDEVVERVNAGESPIEGEPGVPESLSRLTSTGALRATTDASEAAAEATVHVVIVPTTLVGVEPDLSNLAAVSEAIGSGLDPGDLVLIESTVPPGTCLELVEPLLTSGSGLSADQFGLAFCPERTMSGQALADIRGTHPKVVGGRDVDSAYAAMQVYQQITSNDVIAAPDITTAECVKVFEGVYRDVNIALANELARLVDEIDVDVNRAIDIANTQPYCDIHDPGIGVGGHCIPYYPYFLISALETPFPLLQTARDINDEMAVLAVERLVEGLEDQDVPLPVDEATVLVLGLAYRPGVNETRKSPAFTVATELTERGATVYGTDPVVDDDLAAAFDLTPVELDAIADLDLDAVVLVTAHPEFEDIDWGAFDELVFIDGRGALSVGGTEHRVYTIGSGVTN
jgi:UDP-N-acetyl-D-mannosaminuronic acid dehydrogenase